MRQLNNGLFGTIIFSILGLLLIPLLLMPLLNQKNEQGEKKQDLQKEISISRK
ncbi:hypothetical protein KMW28_28345 [Flammeovirga yaeyamensis]|uniref:Uncharacterized protein n=1 Tax=Flammeovirga yaeyamensis TaxID=367791 RepID=A0AAX1NBH1_9BACT|nr:hypothetical protein [Flammeovirga yaeyamensis]MBB3697273.1 plastocyanin domain-containing protein [Flammeovirga yaeyamensis]NMF33930.1 hypothetical protein [Flammeovirga yaeyamensis]QWG04810.1 hypothetical protein KMW28_28345 [Flammeovirga yaeyamensis]